MEGVKTAAADDRADVRDYAAAVHKALDTCVLYWTVLYWMDGWMVEPWVGVDGLADVALSLSLSVSAGSIHCPGPN